MSAHKIWNVDCVLVYAYVYVAQKNWYTCLGFAYVYAWCTGFAYVCVSYTMGLADVYVWYTKMDIHVWD